MSTQRRSWYAAASGIAATALSTLGLLYMIQSMPAAHRLKGIVLGIGVPRGPATLLARLFSSDLLELGAMAKRCMYSSWASRCCAWPRSSCLGCRPASA